MNTGTRTAMTTREQTEANLAALADELTDEDAANLRLFAIHESWRALAPKLTAYLNALSMAKLEFDERPIPLGLETWTTRDVADGLVGTCGMLDVSLSPTFEGFAMYLQRLLAAENVVRLLAAPAIAAMN